MRAPAIIVAATVAGLVAACGSGGWKSGAPGQYQGTTLQPPLAAPDFTLTTTDGRPYHFRVEARGYVALLFFGYTHCPDVCPVHMANLASVLARVPPGVAGSVKVMFVTVDPARDTPPVLRAWLDKFDHTFVGLRGPLEAVNRIEGELRMPQTVVERLADGQYAVGHAAAIIAIVGDSVRVLYPFGTRQGDWLHDLPMLVAAIPHGRGAD
jgi:protein SCO1/2